MPALPAQPMGPIVSSPATRGGVSYAMMEFAPASGAGMSSECACTNVSAATGQPLVLNRPSTAVCTKGSFGFRLTNIADGDLVECGVNLPRIERDADGFLSLLAETQNINDCLRSRALCTTPWADVGTPNCLADTQVGPFGASTMDSIADDNAAAFEGRTQSIATTSATVHAACAYMKAGTATSASLTMVGTGSSTGDCTASGTGLSSTSSTRICCVSPAAYAGTLTAVAITVRVGSAVGDMGTLFVEEVDHYAATAFIPHPIPTDNVSVTRSSDVATITLSPAMSASIGSHAINVTPAWGASGPMGGITHFLRYDPSGQPMYFVSFGSTLRMWDGTSEPSTSTTFTALASRRIWSSYVGSTQSINDGLTTGTGSFDGTLGAGALTTISICNGGGSVADALCSRVCVDPSDTRCR